MEKTVHPGDGGSHEVTLLAIETDVSPLLALAAQVGDGREEHASGAAGGIVDGFARLRLEHLGHEMDDGAVGVELGGGVAGIVGEFLDEVFIALSQLVFGQVGKGELERAEVLDQVAQHGVGEAVLVGPLGVAEDAVELVRVGGLNDAHGGLEHLPDVLGGLSHFAPMGIGRNLKAMVLRVGSEFSITAGFRQRGLSLFVKDVAQTFVEEQRKDELLVVARVNGPAE